MIGLHEIYARSIARAGGIEVPPGVRVFPDPDPPLPGMLWRGGRALVRGAVVLATAIYRAHRRQRTKARDAGANIPEVIDPTSAMAAAQRRDPAPPDTDNDNVQAPRAA